MEQIEEAEQLAAQIRARETWDLDLCKALCKMAGMEEDFEAREDAEPVVEKAAEKLGVEIY